MKKTLFIFIFLAAGISCANAQKFYARAGIGYSFPHAGQLSGTSTGTQRPLTLTSGSTTANNNITTFEIKKSSFAAGAFARIAGGYMFTENVGIDLEAAAGVLPKEHTLNTSYGSSTTYVQKETFVQKAATPVLLTPAIVLQASSGICRVYTRCGIALPLRAQIKEEYTYTRDEGPAQPITETMISSVQKPKFSIGLSAAVGASFMLSEKLSFWAEASLLSMSLYAAKSKVTKYIRDGKDYTDGLPAYLKETTYSLNGNSATVQQSYAIPFSNVGASIGFAYRF